MLRRWAASGQPTPTAPPWDTPFDPHASEADILACFRLLLGRSPNHEEWRGHSDRAGQELSGVVVSYLNSLEFARRELLRHDVPSVKLTEQDGFRLYADPADAAVGRHAMAGVYEPEVTAIFRRMVRPGMGVLDLGANIGYFSMLSASLAGPSGLVVAVEPNPRNVKLLEASRRANGFDQMRVCQVAAGPEPGLLMLNTSHSNGTTSGLPPELASLFGAEIVPCVTADSLVPPERRVDLVKVDVEGAEYLALSGAVDILRRDRPMIVSEFSPGLMPGISGISGPEYLDWLRHQGYALGVVQLDGSVDAGDADNGAIMAVYERRGIDHIDVLATPAAGFSR